MICSQYTPHAPPKIQPLLVKNVTERAKVCAAKTCECPLQLPLNYSLQIVFYQNFSDLNTI